MKIQTYCLFVNIALMVFTAWLIYHFNNGWWILLYVFCSHTFKIEKKEVKDDD